MENSEKESSPHGLEEVVARDEEIVNVLETYWTLKDSMEKLKESYELLREEYISHVDSSDTEKHRLENENAECFERINQLSVDNRELTLELESCKRLYSVAENQSKNSSQVITEMESGYKARIETLETRLADSTARCRELEQHLSAANGQLSLLAQSNDGIMKSVREEHRQEVSRLTSELERLRVSQGATGASMGTGSPVIETTSGLRTAIDRLTLENEKQQNQLSESRKLLNSLDDYKREYHMLESRCESQLKSLRDIQTSYHDKDRQVMELLKETGHLRGLQQGDQARAKSLELELASKQSNLENLQRQLDEWNQRQSDYAARTKKRQSQAVSTIKELTSQLEQAARNQEELERIALDNKRKADSFHMALMSASSQLGSTSASGLPAYEYSGPSPALNESLMQSQSMVNAFAPPKSQSASTAN